MGPNELTRQDLSAAPNGAFSRPVKRQWDSRESNHVENRERKITSSRGTKTIESIETDNTDKNEGRVASESEKRGIIKKSADHRTQPNVNMGTQISRDGGLNKADAKIGPHMVQKGTYNKSSESVFCNGADARKPREKERNISVKPCDSDPIRSHLLDTNRFYRSHLWRELPSKPGDRSFRPVTPRSRLTTRDPNHITWHQDSPRQMDNNRTDRAFRPVTPRRQRYHDPSTFSQSPTRCSSILPSPESILQTQIKALQSQSLHENVINKDQPNGELLRGLG